MSILIRHLIFEQTQSTLHRPVHNNTCSTPPSSVQPDYTLQGIMGDQFARVFSVSLGFRLSYAIYG